MGRFRFSLRTFWIVITLSSVVAFFVLVPAITELWKSRAQRQVADRISALGGNVAFSNRFLEETDKGISFWLFVLGRGRLVTISTVDLADTDITDTDLAVLRQAPDTELLVLRNTKVGDASVKYLTNNASLRILDLRKTRFSREGVAKLRRLFPDATIYWQQDVGKTKLRKGDSHEWHCRRIVGAQTELGGNEASL